MPVKSAQKRPAPDFHHETLLGQKHGTPVAGIDEAGRGPWAGPVVAAAVILDENNIPEGLNDSKKLGEAHREQLFGKICNSAVVGIGIMDVEVIDRDNILNATLAAMQQAIAKLPVRPAVALIDGNRCPDLPCPAEALVKGDQLSLSIAAASIIAKVTRDRIMCEMALEYPRYGFEKHKGYGTRAHQQALTQYGVTPHHRRSFKPVRKLIENGPS